jgi:hypothetical protein
MVTFAWLLSDPEVPISSMVVVLLGARLLALKVIVTLTLPFGGGVTGLAEAVPDTPLGNLLTLSSTGERDECPLTALFGRTTSASLCVCFRKLPATIFPEPIFD